MPLLKTLQKCISAYCFLALATNNICFAYYVIFAKPSLKEVMGFLTVQVTIFHFSVGYYIVHIYARLCLDTIELCRIHFRPIGTGSDKLKRAIEEESKLVVKLTLAFVVGVLMGVLIYTPWIGDEDKICFVIYLINIYPGDGLLKKFLTMCIYPPALHGTYITNIPMFVVIYFMLQVKFQIALLIEQVEGLNLPVHESVSEYIINDVNYQKKIYRRLVACIHHHRDIKRLKQKLDKLFYWPTFVLVASVLAFETSLIIPLLGQITPSSNCRYIFILILTALSHTIYAFIGQKVVDESEKLHLAVKCCNWYNWDRKNRKLLMMFLVHSQEPMAFSSSDILAVSNELLVKSYKALYSIITFYRSLANRAPRE